MAVSTEAAFSPVKLLKMSKKLGGLTITKRLRTEELLDTTLLGHRNTGRAALSLLKGCCVEVLERCLRDSGCEDIPDF